MGIWEKWLLSMIITFAMRQVAKWKKSINWALVRVDVAKRVADLVPGTWFDDEARTMADRLIDVISQVLNQTDSLETVLKLLAQSKYDDAIALIKKLILDNFMPVSDADHKLLAYVGQLDTQAPATEAVAPESDPGLESA